MGKIQRTPFSIEIKICDENGRKIFMWHNSRGNLLLGIDKATDFVIEKLGIDHKTIIERKKQIEEATRKILGEGEKNEEFTDGGE